jgi:hypothetical protein
VQTNKTGVIPHVQARKTDLFKFWKCEITINHNRLRKSQAKSCVTMETPNITTPTHLIIKQATLQIPKVWAIHNFKNTIRVITDTCKFA